jgi:hypothetical protein
MASYLTIEYDNKLEVSRVVMSDGRIIETGVPLAENPIGPGTVTMITVSEIVEWTDHAGVSRVCVHHRCRKYC